MMGNDARYDEMVLERIVSVKTFLCVIMKFHFKAFSNMSTVHVI